MATTRADRGYEYGILLPHFGSAASREHLIDDARRLEEYGLDSMWVRDHIVYHPHPHEDPNQNHVDPFVVLSAIAAVTTRVRLATGTLIPHRHPIYTALLFGSLDYLAGPGRLIAGFGLGTYQHEFDAVGLSGIDRKKMIREYVEVLRKLWTGEVVTHHGTYFDFEEVDIHPVPGEAAAIPIWYGGASKAAVRRAVEYCDGSLHGWTPVWEFGALVRRMHLLAEEAGREEPPDVGIIPIVVPADSPREAWERLDLDRVYAMATRFYGPPPGKESYESVEDLDDAALVGDADAIVAGIRRFQEQGARHVVLDMRHSFDRWDTLVEFLGRELLPRLHADDGRSGEAREGE